MTDTEGDHHDGASQDVPGEEKDDALPSHIQLAELLDPRTAPAKKINRSWEETYEILLPNEAAENDAIMNLPELMRD